MFIVTCDVFYLLMVLPRLPWGRALVHWLKDNQVFMQIWYS